MIKQGCAVASKEIRLERLSTQRATNSLLYRKKTKSLKGWIMLSEKIHSPSFYLSDEILGFIQVVATSYHISRSEVIEWAINAHLKPYDKALKLATRRIYARKAPQKVQNATSKYHKAKKVCQEAKQEQKRLFDPRAY